MRTHIRMHFEKKTSDLNEEQYMTCILEDEPTEIPSVAALTQDQLAQLAAVQKQQQQQQAAIVAAAVGLQQQQQQQAHMFNCDACNYTSTYKGNVLRHMKLVHPHLVSLSPSMSPEDMPEIDIASDEGASQTGSFNSENNAQSCIIKTEPFESGTLDVTQMPLHEKIPSPLAQSSSHLEGISNMKSEPVDVVVDATQSTNMLSSPGTISTNTTTQSTLNAALKIDEMINQKYCQTCDISFTYMNTFLAHKQYYCKNKLSNPQINKSPSPNTASLAIPTIHSPNTLMHAQKNKENMQQEAAI